MHTHTCLQCGHQWDCDLPIKKRSKLCEIMEAVRVNGDGPLCQLCYHMEMAHRIAAGRKIILPCAGHGCRHYHAHTKALKGKRKSSSSLRGGPEGGGRFCGCRRIRARRTITAGYEHWLGTGEFTAEWQKAREEAVEAVGGAFQ